MQTRPLSGYRVLDLSNVLAGPFCCHQLAHLGSDVIKIERPGSGDLARQLGAEESLNKQLMGVSYLAQNSGKRSITLDLKSDGGKAVFHKLLSTADVLVENYRPGVMTRLGLAYPDLKADYPELIYCAISGFGQHGPIAEAPAYDQIVQGMSGVMSITGSCESAPNRVGYPIADTIGGMTAAFAIAAALAHPSPGRGAFIDVSMLDSMLATMGWVVSNYLVAGKIPQAMGNDNFTASPSGTFRTGDGLINIAANRQVQFESLCHIVARPELISDERFKDRQQRLNNRAALTALLEESLCAETSAHWVDKFNRAGVPAGPVLTVPDILDHPQIRARDLVTQFDDVPGMNDPLKVVRTGLHINGHSPSTESRPPQLGEQTDSILSELGFTVEEINNLRNQRAI
ncbi:MAG: CoA transferase [Granulosicoccus sp.]|nr:CoA transferase [Granulosicoccus sp.]